MSAPEGWLSVKELAAHYGVSKSKIWRLLRDGLPHIRMGMNGQLRFNHNDVTAWLATRGGTVDVLIEDVADDE